MPPLRPRRFLGPALVASGAILLCWLLVVRPGARAALRPTFTLDHPFPPGAKCLPPMATLSGGVIAAVADTPMGLTRAADGSQRPIQHRTLTLAPPIAGRSRVVVSEFTHIRDHHGAPVPLDDLRPGAVIRVRGEVADATTVYAGVFEVTVLRLAPPPP